MSKTLCVSDGGREYERISSMQKWRERQPVTNSTISHSPVVLLGLLEKTRSNPGQHWGWTGGRWKMDDKSCWQEMKKLLIISKHFFWRICTALGRRGELRVQREQQWKAADCAFLLSWCQIHPSTAAQLFALEQLSPGSCMGGSTRAVAWRWDACQLFQKLIWCNLNATWTN